MRGDGARAGRGDALLELGQLRGQRGLVADRGGQPPHQPRDLGARLDEAEDVVDEQQHVAAHLVAEVLGHGQGGQPHPEAGAGRFVHLAEDEDGLGEDAGLGFISRHRSLPSRERSPIPAKTEPRVLLDARRMSSMMSTVLPTPAPPNMPALPPSTRGASRSMTFMPVWKTRVEVVWARRGGAGRWMGQRGPG